jgi:hypothetical protein
MLYDTFTHTNVYFYDPASISKLSFKFYDINGDLFNFYGINHSFVIEITLLDNSLPYTNIDKITGIEY